MDRAVRDSTVPVSWISPALGEVAMIEAERSLVEAFTT
jgi:hypothetical protein